LHARLDADSALVVVQAPAGFGKTTLVAEWADSHTDDDAAIVWMDASHSTTDRFWSDLAAAFAESGIALDPRLDSPYTAILAAVHARSTGLTLVLDRFDTLVGRRVQEDLHDMVVRRRLLKVIGCVRRSDAIDATLWSDVTTESVRPHDLMFTRDETVELTRVLEMELDEDSIHSLHEAVDGWPGPTKALALEMRDAAHGSADFAAAASSIAREHLRRQVLSGPVSDGDVNFILATAVPETVTEDAARVLTGDEGAGQRLRALEDRGLFATGADGDGIVYRWPTAARAVLREELTAKDPEHAMALEARLAEWHASNRSFGSAIKHALAANDMRLAARIVDLGWPELIKKHLPELNAALAAIPLELVARHPQAAAIRDVQLHLAAHSDDFLLSLPDPLPKDQRELEALARSDRALETLRTATAMMLAFRLRGRSQQATRYGDIAETVGRIGRLRRPTLMASFVPNAFLQVGITRGFADDLPGAIEILRVTYELAPNSESEHVAVDAAGKLALFHALLGHPKQASAWLDHHGRPYRKTEWMEKWVTLGGAIAETLAAVDRLEHDEAAEAIGRMRLAARQEQTWSPFVTYARARYALQWGDRFGALAMVQDEKVHRRAWLREGSTMRPLLDAVEADLLMALGMANHAELLLSTAPDHRALDASRARYALLSGQTERALRATAAGLSRTGVHPAQAELLLIAAAAENRLGRASVASQYLEHAIDTVRATGSLRALASIARPELEALADGIAGAADMLDRIETTRTPFPPELRMVEITEREQLILERLADDMTTHAIAEDLFVSRNTVKSQMRSLYQKLGVNSRDEAIARAHEYGFLATSGRVTSDGRPVEA